MAVLLRSLLIPLGLLSALLTVVPLYGQSKAPSDCNQTLLSPLQNSSYDTELQAAAARLKGYGIHIDRVTGEIRGDLFESGLASRIERYIQNPGVRFSAAQANGPTESMQHAMATSDGWTIWIHPRTLNEYSGHLRILEMIVEHEVEHTRQTLNRNASSMIAINNWGPLNHLNSNANEDLAEKTTYASRFRFDELEARVVSLDIFDPQSAYQVSAEERGIFNQTLSSADLFYSVEMAALTEADRAVDQVSENEIRFENLRGIFNVILKIERNGHVATVEVPYFGLPSDYYTKKAYLQTILAKRHLELKSLFQKIGVLRARL